MVHGLQDYSEMLYGKLFLLSNMARRNMETFTNCYVSVAISSK